MSRIFLMGDIHGKWQFVENLCKKKDTTIEDKVILLGDTGLNFFTGDDAWRNKNIKKKLAKLPITIIAMRGNHDGRIYPLFKVQEWNWKMYEGNILFYEEKYSNILYMFDEVSTYTFDGCLFVAIPGAYSVDKYYRLQQGWTWHEDEMLTLEEMENGRKILNGLIEIQNSEAEARPIIIISHTCPAIYEPTDLFLPHVDQSMVDKTMERYLGEFEYNVNYDAWFWGHYHVNRDYPRTDNRIRTMLGEGTAVELGQVLEGDTVEWI